MLRRSQDRLWDDEFIDLCDDWAVPYIGDLVGTRMVSALDKRGRRIDVAKTIYYRRRKGTPRVLEELIADITAWDGKVVEAFRRLGRTRHGLDPASAPRTRAASRGRRAADRGSAPAARRRQLADGPFDEYAHLADVRRQRGRDGRWNIPKLRSFSIGSLSSRSPRAHTSALEGRRSRSIRRDETCRCSRAPSVR